MLSRDVGSGVSTAGIVEYRLRMKPLTTLALLVACFVAALPAKAQTKMPALSAAGSAALTARLDTAASRGEVPAIVVLVTNAEGVVFEHAAGRQNVAANTPLRPDTIFRIASMTKAITSAAIMTLVEEGKVRLGDPASVYVPAIGDMKVAVNIRPDGSFDTRAPKRAITILDLLTHTSGIGYSFSDPLLFKLQTKGTPDSDFPLLHDPGEKWTYGASTRYLGDVVRQASGQPIDVFLRSRFFEPLGMSDTGYVVPAPAAGRVVTEHQREGVNGPLTERPNPATLETVPPRGDGGLFSTARDYAKFLRLFLNNGRAGSTRILTEYSIADMTKNHLGTLTVREQPAANASRTRPFPLGAGRDTWGLGFQLAARPTMPNRRGAGSYSWAGIDNTYFWVDPTRRIGVVVLMQLLPFYDEAALKLLTDVEELVNKHVS